MVKDTKFQELGRCSKEQLWGSSITNTKWLVLLKNNKIEPKQVLDTTSVGWLLKNEKKKIFNKQDSVD